MLKFKVKHAIPGRMRIHVPYSQKIPKKWQVPPEKMNFFTQIDGVNEVTFSYITGNALILYDSSKITQDEIMIILKRAAEILQQHRKEICHIADQDQERALKFLQNLLETHFDLTPGK